MFWNTFLLAIVFASAGFRLYCEFHDENIKLKMLLPIINIVAISFGYLVIVPQILKLSLFSIYIKPDYTLLYALDIVLVMVLTTNVINLIKEIKKNK